MKKQLTVCVGILLAGMGVFAADIMVSWVSNGVLQASGMIPGSTCTVQRTSNLTNSFSDVTSEVAGVSGITRTEVSLEQNSSFFKVRVDAPTGATPEGMVAIPAGTNSGTNPLGDEEIHSDVYPETYSLTVDAFYMDQYEVTKAQWDTVYNWAVANDYSFDNAGSGKASNHPVQMVNWYDCVKWCNARSEKEGRVPCYTVTGSTYKTGQSSPDCNFNTDGYRLPTNDEWEYAARGGLSGKRFPWGDTINHDNANYRANESIYSYDTSPYTSDTYHPDYDDGGEPYTSPGGTFLPNEYELYDMTGNVWEWSNTEKSSGRSVRGGSWESGADYARCARANWHYSDHPDSEYGLRAVCR